MPTIEGVMSPLTTTVGADAKIESASRLMRALDIRHLPVLESGRLCGVVSERDLLLLETAVGREARDTTVSDAMSVGVYAVPPTAPLDMVLRAMAINKYGCTVVFDGVAVVGILTTVDVCRLFAEYLVRGASRARGATETVG